MPDWTNSKLFSVLLAAALAVSCYPVPVRAFADDLESEVVSDASNTDSGHDLAGGVRPAESDDISAYPGFSDVVVSPGDNEGEGVAQEPGFESDGVSLGGSPSEEIAFSGLDSVYLYGLLPDGFDETDLATYPDWAIYSDYIGLGYDQISSVIDGLTEKRYAETLSYDETITYFQACYALLLLLQDEGYDSSSYGWGTVSTIVGIFDTVLGWSNPSSNSDSKLATVLTALVYGVQVDSNGNISFPLDSAYSSRGIAGLLVNQLNYLANISSNSNTSNSNLSIIASNSANLSNRSIYNGYSFARMLYGIWDDLEKDGYSAADFLAAIDTNLHSNGYGAARLLYEVWDDLEYSVSGKSYSVAHSAYGIWEDVEILDGHVVNNGSLVSKGFSDVYGSLSASVDGGVLSAAQILGHIRGRLGADRNGVTYGLGSLASMTYDRLGTVDGRLHTSVDGGDLSAAQILGHIRGRLGADRNGVTYGLGSLASMTYDRLGTVDGKLSLGDNGSVVSVAGFAQQIRNRLQYVTGNNTYTAAGLLYRIWQAGISDASLVSKGFSDVIAALDTREVVITGDLELGDVTVDNSDVVEQVKLSNMLLGDIVDLLFLAGVKDLVDDFLGDFDSIVSATQLAAVQSAMQNAFPFCIPAVFKQVLGLFAFEGAPPVFEFDIGGTPFVLDFSVAGEFAEISRWVVTVAFIVLLLANTRNFVYDFTGGAA